MAEVTIKSETHGDFAYYDMGWFYVISRHSTYRAARKQKVFKTYKSARNAWAKVLSGETDYVNF